MESQQKRHKISMSLFAESVYLLDGNPFRLTDRHYLKAIYDSNIEEGIIMSGRQVEKSTTSSTHIANYTLCIPYFKALYFAPLTDQVKVFSKERIGKLYNYSQADVINREYKDKHSVDAVFEKSFKNGSVNYFKHCYEYGDNIRGITVNGIWGDEIQDIHTDAIPIIKETQSHAMEAGARMKVTWYTGTPKTFGNTIQQYWDKSTQNEWVVRCPHCGKHQILGVKNLTPTMYICIKCSMEIPKYAITHGRWYALAPKNNITGFRISQLMVPWITPEDIWKKYKEYSPDKFFNEVLGRSYESASKPFNALALSKLFNNTHGLMERPEGEFTNGKTYMGVDWGKGDKSFTVVTIYGLGSDGKLFLLYSKRYESALELDHDYQVDDISRLMTAFRINYCIVDWGFGFTQYQRLKKRFGARVAACYYSFNLKAENKWDPIDSKWIVNRTKVISEYITKVNKCEFVWAGKNRSQLVWFQDHHLNVTSEYRKSQNGKSEELFYNHAQGNPDDGMHSSIYAWLAFKLDCKSASGGGIQFYSAYGSNI